MIEYANVQVSDNNLLVAIVIPIIFWLSHMRKQPNYSDCGLFAVANAMAICNGQKPEEQLYDVTITRRHLVGCFEDKQFRHFPARKRQIAWLTRRMEVVDVYCVCQLPKSPGEKMITCDQCGEWYHNSCLAKGVHVPAEAWLKPDYKWTCPYC